MGKARKTLSLRLRCRPEYAFRARLQRRQLLTANSLDHPGGNEAIHRPDVRPTASTPPLQKHTFASPLAHRQLCIWAGSAEKGTNLANKTHPVGPSPSFKTESITDNKDVKKWLDSYLGVGEMVMDNTVAIAGSSSWFKRER